MWIVNELIVLSDLHLTPERNTGSFQSDNELAQCLRWVLTETRDCLVVLAGDALDFLTANDCPSRSGFERFSCHAKRITDHHPEVFDALGKLAQSPQHALVFMSGECDAELMIPQVQETIERRLGLTTPKGSVRWLVLGEALRVQVGSAVILVEHGNGFDPWNRMDHAWLQMVLSLASRNLPEPKREYQEPFGLELVSKVLNRMRSRHRWVDCLRPANESILPLLWRFASGEEQGVILKLADLYESMKTEAALKKLSNSHDPVTLYHGEKEAYSSPEDDAFKDWIDSIYEQQSGVKTSNRSLTEKVRLVCGRNWSVESEQPHDTTKYLQPMFDGGADLIIHGHTHVCGISAVNSGLYINAGTWSQLLRLPASHESNGVWDQFIEQLGTNTVDSFVRPTLAHVYKQQETEPIGALVEWRFTHPETLAAHRLKNSRSH